MAAFPISGSISPTLGGTVICGRAFLQSIVAVDFLVVQVLVEEERTSQCTSQIFSSDLTVKKIQNYENVNKKPAC